MDEPKKKKTFYVKNPTQNKTARFCLHCGADISHRSKGVQFCCPNCKATYKLMQEMRAKDKPKKPKLKTTPQFHEDAASVYYPNEANKVQNQKAFNPIEPDKGSNMSQIEKFNARYKK